MSGIKDLKNKVVLVTGGGAGIGRTIALEFAKRGSHIVATDINAEALDGVKREIEALGVRCGTYVVDVSNEAAMRQLAEDVATNDGVPDVLINNAGIGFLGAFLKSTLDHWPRVFGVNVFGVVNGCRYFVPKMVQTGKQAKRRQVVIIASGAAHFPPPNAAAYGASKAAVFSFAESLKMDLTGTNVGVTTVCPGITNTGIVNKPADPGSPVTDEQRKRMREYYVKKGATPESIAEAVVKGVEKGSDLVLAGPASRLMYNLRRISLPLTRKITYASAGQAGFR